MPLNQRWNMGYKELFEHSSAFVFIIDLEGNLLSVNNQFIEGLGYKKAKKIMKRKLNEIIQFPEESFDTKELVDIFLRAYKKQNQKTFKLIGRKQKDILVKAEIIPYKKEKELYGLLLIARDISDQKNLESELDSRKRELEEIYKKAPEIRFWGLFQEKESQELLKQSEKDYKTLFDNAPIGLITINKEGNLLQSNKRAKKIFQFFELGVSNENLNVFKSKIFKKSKINKILEKARTKEKIIDKTIEFPINNQDKKYLSLRIVPQYNQKKKLISFLCVLEDRTELIKTEKKLNKSRKKYKKLSQEMELILDHLPGLVFYKDTHNRYIRVNKRVAEAHKMEKEDLIGKSVYELYPKEEAEQYFKNDMEIFKNGKPKLGIEEPWDTAAGRKWLSTSKIPLYDDNGEPIGIIGLSVDITKRKETKRKLRKSEKKYRGILENIQEGYFEVDMEGRFTLCNKSFCNILKDSSENIIGTSYENYIIKNFKSKVSKTFSDVYQTGISKKAFQFKIKRADGQKRYVETSIYLRHDKEKGFFGLIRDITERKQAELLKAQFNDELEQEVKERTKQLNEALEQQKLYMKEILKASKFKSKFLATMSHELRTPLNAIIGFADLLLEGAYGGDLSEIQKEFIEDIKNSGKHLLELINQILDISKIEEGKLELDIKKFSLNKVVNQIISSFKSMIYKKGLKLEIKNLPEDTNIVADPIRIKEILNNLISNSIKFTNQGVIMLDFQEKVYVWEFQVSDTGVGIAKEDYEIVFSEFNRIDNADVSKSKGTGLGLPITKRLVELHGGDIWFESELNQGSTFYFTIPKPRVPTSQKSDKNYRKNQVNGSEIKNRYVSIIKYNFSERLVTDTIFAILTKNPILIIKKENYLKKPFLEFINYITENNFNGNLSFLSPDQYSQNEKKYENHNVINDNEILNTVGDFSEHNHRTYLKQLIREFYNSEDSIEVSKILKTKLNTLFTLAKNILDYIKKKTNVKDVEKIGRRELIDVIKEKFSQKIDSNKLELIKIIIEQYFDYRLPEFYEGIPGFLDFL